MNHSKIEKINGKYLNLNINKQTLRIFFEENGNGIPLVCLHTAGSDSRQFRHLLNSKEITENYRVIAFDLPWHGKSDPPANYMEIEYKLTTKSYMNIIINFCKALNLKNPVVIGCSMGGRIALHLALKYSSFFKAVIALEGADKLEPYYDLSWLNRPDVHGGEIQAAFVSSQVAPTSPDEYRWETLWHYMQGGPGVFKGDLHFYWLDGDFDERSPQINTKACPVYLMSGEYDCSCTPERTLETASRIRGSKVTIMQGMGHFPMSENPALFKTYLMPILSEIANIPA